MAVAEMAKSRVENLHLIKAEALLAAKAQHQRDSRFQCAVIIVYMPHANLALI